MTVLSADLKGSTELLAEPRPRGGAEDSRPEDPGAGTPSILRSLNGHSVGFRPQHLVYPFLAASRFGVAQIARMLGLGHAGPVFDTALNTHGAPVRHGVFM